jgi:hypothetical protein
VQQFLSFVAGAFEALTVTDTDVTFTKFELGCRTLIEFLKVPSINTRLDEFNTFFFWRRLPASRERQRSIQSPFFATTPSVRGGCGVPSFRALGAGLFATGGESDKDPK